MRSERARRAAEIRWERYHAQVAELGVRRELPALRRRLTVEDFVSGERHVLELWETNRIDQFRVTVDGRPWKERIGMSGILAGVRKGLGRLKGA